MTMEGQAPEALQVNSVTNGRLQEIRFWVTIMKEHALFIALGLPCDQISLIEQARAYAAAMISQQRGSIVVARLTLASKSSMRRGKRGLVQLSLFDRREAPGQ